LWATTAQRNTARLPLQLRSDDRPTVQLPGKDAELIPFFKRLGEARCSSNLYQKTTACLLQKLSPSMGKKSPVCEHRPQPAFARMWKNPGMGEASQVASLINPAKLATLRERGANPRILKITAILWSAKAAGKKPTEITQAAVEKIGWGGTHAGELTTAAILRNLQILEELGSTTPEDIGEMKKGNPPPCDVEPTLGKSCQSTTSFQ
jgi:hypothetical protein